MSKETIKEKLEKESKIKEKAIRHSEYDEESVMLNKLIGENLYLTRLSKGVSMEILAKRIGVSYEQLRKYEKGFNRISASKLLLVSRALEIPMEYFYGEPNMKINQLNEGKQELYIKTLESLARIEDRSQRKALYDLIKSIAPYKRGTKL